MMPHCGGAMSMFFVGRSGLDIMLVRVVGSGKSTLFWSEVWVGEVSLRDRFPRLFDLSLFKDLSVFDMCQLGWGVEGQAWSWRRRLLAWEEEAVGELILLLQSVSLQVDSTDTWRWKLEISHVFSVRSAYTVLTSESVAASTMAVTTPWHLQVPVKVVLFAWRMFRERLPMKDNLLHRGVITLNSRLCTAGCNSVELPLICFCIALRLAQCGITY